MKKQFLKLVIILVSISLVGVVTTQTFWLKKLIYVAEKQYHHRADRMLENTLIELKQHNNKSCTLRDTSKKNLILYDVIDTTLLKSVIKKYTTYHHLNADYHFALVRNSDGKIIFKSPGYKPEMDQESYKSCLSCIWQKEYLHLSVYFPNKGLTFLRQMRSWIVLSILFLFLITAAFVYIFYSIIRQKKISEIKNDFINNMTHEFKTPISTISLASEILIKDSENSLSGKVGKYSKIIFDENQRMQSQVELVLQTAQIDRGQIKLNKEVVDFNELIQSTVKRFCHEDCDNNTSFEYKLRLDNPFVSLDTMHIQNVIGNIIDNAIKYSVQSPDIILAAKNVSTGISFSIRDNGIGMTRETQKKIFDKFFRVSTGDVHNIKGFGLGLYYVKTIIDAHQGHVSVQSYLNRGSTFHVYLPQI